MIFRVTIFIISFIAVNSILKEINCFQVNGIEFDKNQVHKTEVFERYVQAVKDENQALALKNFKDSIDKRYNDLDANFENQTNKFFWNMQTIAKNLNENGIDSKTGNVIKKISNLIARIAYKQYAINKKANDVSKEILNQNDSYWLESSAKTLDRRVQLRAYIAGFQVADLIWKTIHLFFKQYINLATVSKEFKQFFIDCHKERERFGKLAYKASLEQDREYAKYARQADKDKFENSKDFLSRIDKLIDETSGCKEACSNLADGTWETFYAKPLFLKDTQILNNLINQYVPKDLIDAIEASDISIKEKIVDISTEEASKVSEDDMEDFEDRFLKSEGLLTEMDIDNDFDE